MKDNDDAKKIRIDLERMAKRLSGEKGEPFSKEELAEKIGTAKAWVEIMEESQRTREKFGQQFSKGDFKLRSGNDAASARVAVDELEEEVYGSYVGALRKRIENVERALKEQEGAL